MNWPQSRKIVFFISVPKVAQKTYICGDEPCSILAQSFFEWLTGKGFLFLVLIMIFFLITPTMFIGLWHAFSGFIHNIETWSQPGSRPIL